MKCPSWLIRAFRWLSGCFRKSASFPPAGGPELIHPGAGAHAIRIRSPFLHAGPNGDRTRTVKVVGLRGFHAVVQSTDDERSPLFTLITESDVLPESVQSFRDVCDYLRSQRLADSAK